MATLRECIEAFERSQANRSPDRPIRVIRAVLLPIADARFTLQKTAAYHAARPTGRKTEVRRAFAALEMAERLGIERVGLVVATWEAAP